MASTSDTDMISGATTSKMLATAVGFKAPLRSLPQCTHIDPNTHERCFYEQAPGDLFVKACNYALKSPYRLCRDHQRRTRMATRRREHRMSVIAQRTALAKWPQNALSAVLSNDDVAVHQATRQRAIAEHNARLAVLKTCAFDLKRLGRSYTREHLSKFVQRAHQQPACVVESIAHPLSHSFRMTSVEVLRTHLATAERLDDTLRAYERLLHRKTRMQRSKYHSTLNSMLGTKKMSATTFSALERFVPDDDAKTFDERFETYAAQKQYSRRQRALYNYARLSGSALQCSIEAKLREKCHNSSTSVDRAMPRCIYGLSQATECVSMLDEAVIEGVAPIARLHARRITIPGATAPKRRVQVDGDSIELAVPFTPKRLKSNDFSTETSSASFKSTELSFEDSANSKAPTTIQSKPTECTEAALPMALYCAKHILQDPKQVLFRACAGTVRNDGFNCPTPVLPYFAPLTEKDPDGTLYDFRDITAPLCSMHMLNADVMKLAQPRSNALYIKSQRRQQARWREHMTAQWTTERVEQCLKQQKRSETTEQAIEQ